MGRTERGDLVTNPAVLLALTTEVVTGSEYTQCFQRDRVHLQRSLEFRSSIVVVLHFEVEPGLEHPRRGEVFVVTKVLTAKAAEALEILQQSLKDLRIDQVDLTYVHSVGDLDTDEVLGADGALEGLRQAQLRGWTRYLGFSAHNRPEKAARILQETEVDVVMLGMNYADRFTYNFEEQVLPLAAARNVGVAAMKVYGGAEAMKYETSPTEPKKKSALEAHGPHDHQTALRYALGLPGVTLAVVGIYNQTELDQNLAWAKEYTPLQPTDLSLLDREGQEIAAAWGAHYGPVRDD